MRLTKLAPVAAMTLLAACASKPKPAADSPVPQVSAGQTEGQWTRPDGVAVSDSPASLAAQFAASAGDRVYFELDSYSLDSAARDGLAAQAAWLTEHPSVRVLIAGNADERGTREYNLALGARRANSVKEFLVSHGVSPQRLATVSHGKERPLDLAANEEAWARNRNAHTVVLEFGDRR